MSIDTNIDMKKTYTKVIVSIDMKVMIMSTDVKKKKLT